MKVKGWVLTYTIVLMLISVLILTSIITVYGFKQQINNTHFTHQKLVLNKLSGLNLYLNHKATNHYPELEELGTDFIELSEHNWGTAKVLKIKSIIAQDTLESAALIGFLPHEKDPIIELASSPYPLKVTGICTLNGPLKVPDAILIRKSKIYSPFSIDYKNTDILNSTLQSIPIFKVGSEFNEPLEYLWGVEEMEVSQSFNDQTKIIYSDDPIALSNILRNNVVVESTKSITISKSAILDNVLLKSPIITFEDNWSGNVQVQASVNIIVGENVKFNYPSSLTIKNHNGDISTFEMKESTVLNGFLLIQGVNKGKPPMIKGTINGYLRSTIPLDLNVQLSGQVLSPSLKHQSHSTSFVNLLYNSTINNEFQKKQIPLPAIVEHGNKALIKWLE